MFDVNSKGGGFQGPEQHAVEITDPDTISRFTADLIAEHMVAQKQSTGAKK